jgi:hypothetical protein
LLDTHIWFWILSEPARIGRRAKAEIARPKNEIWLSPISVWELLSLAERGRVKLGNDPRQWVAKALSSAPAQEAPQRPDARHCRRGADRRPLLLASGEQVARSAGVRRHGPSRSAPPVVDGNATPTLSDTLADIVTTGTVSASNVLFDLGATTGTVTATVVAGANDCVVVLPVISSRSR